MLPTTLPSGRYITTAAALAKITDAFDVDLSLLVMLELDEHPDRVAEIHAARAVVEVAKRLQLVNDALERAANVAVRRFTDLAKVPAGGLAAVSESDVDSRDYDTISSRVICLMGQAEVLTDALGLAIRPFLYSLAVEPDSRQ